MRRGLISGAAVCAVLALIVIAYVQRPPIECVPGDEMTDENGVSWVCVPAQPDSVSAGDNPWPPTGNWIVPGTSGPGTVPRKAHHHLNWGSTEHHHRNWN